MALFDFITLTPKGKIGDVTIQATLEEIASDSLVLTEHPIEYGAAITDHAYKRPAEVTLTCAWSNTAADIFSVASVAALTGSNVLGSNYSSAVYSQLLALQENRTPFSIVTTKRMYENMQIVDLQVTTDNRTSSILNIQVRCRQLLLVYTQATTLPSRTSQANPASTADTQSTGVKQLIPATPSPGGAVAPASF